MTEARLRALCYGGQVLAQIQTGQSTEKLNQEMDELRAILGEAGRRFDA